MKRPRLLAGLAGVSVVALWVIETLLPGLLPIPTQWAWAIVALAAALLAAALGLQALHRLRLRVPGPWISRPPWASRRWLRQRPRVSLLVAAANAAFGVSTLDRLRIHLTIHRSVDRTPRPCRILFDDAVLTLIQIRRGEVLRLRLGPDETGGFLGLPMDAGRSDSVVIEFSLIAAPVPVAQAPDLRQPYRLELDGVRAIVASRHPVAGRLPKAVFQIAPPDAAGG
jgi:hypothetical protein